MNRTRAIFITIIAIALVIVAASIAISWANGSTPNTGLTVDRPDAVTIRILTALPVEPWVRSAAAEFNSGQHAVDGVPIQVEIQAVDGLTALGRWDRDEYGALPLDVRPEDLSEADRQALEDF